MAEHRTSKQGEQYTVAWVDGKLCHLLTHLSQNQAEAVVRGYRMIVAEGR